MKLIWINFLCLIIFVNFGSSVLPNSASSTENINDLRYPRPLNITSIFPFRVLRTIFNMTSIDQSLERGSNRITSQVSAVVDVLRRVLRYMLRNALAVSPLRTNVDRTATKVANNSKVTIDLPVFSAVNETELASPRNETDDTLNNI